MPPDNIGHSEQFSYLECPFSIASQKKLLRLKSNRFSMVSLLITTSCQNFRKNNEVCQFCFNLTIFQLFLSKKCHITLELDHLPFDEN